MRLSVSLGASALLALFVACGGGGGNEADVKTTDTGGSDQSVKELVQPDLTPTDFGTGDLGASDQGQADQGPADPGQTDKGQIDQGPGDTGLTDTGPTDQGPVDIPVGPGDCMDITNCINENQCQTQECMDNCIAQGSAQGQAQFNALLDCQVDKCSQFANSPQQASYCVYTECKTENTPCVQTGNLGCMGILQCGQDCKEDQNCILACVNNGSYDGLTAFLAIGACIDKNCPNAQTEAEIQQCIYGPCMQVVMACQGS